MFKYPFAALAIIAAALLTAGCGDKSNDETPPAGKQADAAYVAAMIPHHRSAVTMAKMAQQKAKHAELREMSNAIVSTQNIEIDQMLQMENDLPRTGESMMSESEISAMEAEADRLDSASDFDRAFLAAMIPHHESAVEMSKELAANGEDAGVKALATSIIEAQNAEIKQMRKWSNDWYGADVSAESEEGVHMTHGE